MSNLRQLSSPVRRLQLAAIVIVAALATAPAIAQQRSLDFDISRIYGEIDQRARDYEAEASQTRTRLEELAQQIESEEERYGSIPQNLTDDQKEMERQKFHARSTELSARYASLAKELLDRAANVISENALALHELTEKIRDTGASAKKVKSLESRIQENVVAGKAMRKAAQDFINLSRREPGMVRYVKRLERIMAPLDRRITLDKARRQAQLQDPYGAGRERHLAGIDRALGTLSDMYINLAVERAALDDMREEIKLAVYLGMVQAAETVAKRAIPGLANLENPEITTVPGLVSVHKRVWELNRPVESVIADDSLVDEQTAVTSVREFQNF